MPGTAEDVTITYDPVYGRVTSQATNTVTTSFGYDTAGRLRTRTDVQYDFDGFVEGLCASSA